DKDPRGLGDPVRELLNRMKPSRLLFACLTHPHDDHYAGLGRLVEHYKKRIDHIWNVDLGGPALKALLATQVRMRARKESLPDADSPKGLERVITRFSEAQKQHGSRPNILHAGIPLLKHAQTDGVTVTACGPAPVDMIRLRESLYEAVERSIERGEAVDRDFDPNIASGALLLRWEQAGVLLAGDLLCGMHEDSGWRHAFDHVDGPVQVVNVAHHASEEAHDGTLWAKMSPALAIVTPFNYGATHHFTRNGIPGKRKYPPRPEQIALLAKSCTVAITSPPHWEDESNAPRATRGVSAKTEFGEKNDALTITPSSETKNSHRNAVAVSLDATGTICSFVLAGQADVYAP
ncbi:MAG TPA: MBL fold metallo-hydrolase, partial [Polyangium sp.]|nr:MBL fold metallo-hydrolase [Polyangium sp.]